MNRLCTALLLLLLFCRPVPGLGFYEYRGHDTEVELRGYFGVGLGQLTYPADSTLYEVRDDRAWSSDLRLLLDADRRNLHLSSNILQSAHSKKPYNSLVRELIPLDVERSSLLTWEQHDSGRVRSELVADSLRLQVRSRRLDLTVGRQPINLATTFYFAPNDFFAPFAPQTFFRNYKPGVDALRGDLRLAELSQLTFLGVLAYDQDISSSNGWSRKPDWSETAMLARVSGEMSGFGWALLAGTVDNSAISGASFQGEIFNGIGLRAEGHYSAPETAEGSSHYKIAAGLEKLYANNFSWRVELFRNSGGDQANGGDLPVVQSKNRNYGAIGFGWEFSPLLTGSFITLAAFDDGSQLLSGNLLYSLSDESELSAIISLPFGEKHTPLSAGSEFGNQPRQTLLEYRLYF